MSVVGTHAHARAVEEVFVVVVDGRSNAHAHTFKAPGKETVWRGLSSHNDDGDGVGDGDLAAENRTSIIHNGIDAVALRAARAGIV